MTLAAVAVTVVAVLTAHNLAAVERWYVPFNLATAALLIGLASRPGGVPLHQLGLVATGATPGLVYGLGAAALVVVAALAPATRPLFRDQRMRTIDARGAAWYAAVRIPLGTVVLEEVAFRGVLPALGVPAAASAALFGVWHVRPTATTLDTNRIAAHRGLVLTAAVVVTAAAGLGFGALREASGGLLAPAIVHAAITSTATVASARVWRRRR